MWLNDTCYEWGIKLFQNILSGLYSVNYDECDDIFSLQDFGSIFSTLLPGTQAKLVAPEGCTLLDGLEVKVAFGDVWKESLSELSGGQRWL